MSIDIWAKFWSKFWIWKRLWIIAAAIITCKTAFTLFQILQQSSWNEFCQKRKISISMQHIICYIECVTNITRSPKSPKWMFLKSKRNQFLLLWKIIFRSRKEFGRFGFRRSEGFTKYDFVQKSHESYTRKWFDLRPMYICRTVGVHKALTK